MWLLSLQELTHETEARLKTFVYPARAGRITPRSYHHTGAKLYPPYLISATMGSCLPHFYLKEAEEEYGTAFLDQNERKCVSLGRKDGRSTLKASAM